MLLHARSYCPDYPNRTCSGPPLAGMPRLKSAPKRGDRPGRDYGPELERGTAQGTPVPRHSAADRAVDQAGRQFHLISCLKLSARSNGVSTGYHQPPEGPDDRSDQSN